MKSFTSCTKPLWGLYLNLHGSMHRSLVARPFNRNRRKGLVHTVHTCAGVSIVTGRDTIVIVCGFCMTTDDKQRVYDRIISNYPSFLGSPVHASTMCIRLLKGLGTRLHAPQSFVYCALLIVNCHKKGKKRHLIVFYREIPKVVGRSSHTISIVTRQAGRPRGLLLDR